jgi:hypothetical protein
MHRQGKFRVELRDHGKVRVLGYITDTHAHHSALEVFLPKLLHEGATGWCVMVDEATDIVIARRRVRATPSSRRTKPGPSRGGR